MNNAGKNCDPNNVVPQEDHCQYCVPDEPALERMKNGELPTGMPFSLFKNGYFDKLQPVTSVVEH